MMHTPPLADAGEATLRADLVAAARRTVELGLNAGSAGNLSVRCGTAILMTPSGIPFDALRDVDCALVTDNAYRGPRRPTTEWRLHRDVLRARADVAAVVHTHAPASTAVACLRREIPALHYYIALSGAASVRCAPYATYGTQDLADNVVRTLGDRYAVLLANHGMLTVGTTLADALRRSHELERIAQLYLVTRDAGAHILSDADVAAAAARLAAYGTAADDDPDLTREG